jgi:hypothetical protein
MPLSRVLKANEDANMPYSDFFTGARYESGRHETDAQVLQAAHHLVEVFLLFLREHEMGSDLLDTQELPASKKALVNAFRVVIATESRPGARALLVKAGMTLAQFQDDIGPRMSVTPVDANNHRNDRHWTPEPGQIRRFDRALTRLGEERTQLSQVFQQAIRMAEKKPTHHA